MRKTAILASILAAFLVNTAIAAPNTERINAIPALTQTDPVARFPYGGVHYCGPCAISNSIMWLGENGYPQLLPSAEGRMSKQVALANNLASEKYMDTTLEWGTSPAGVLEGIEKYIRDCGYKAQLTYQGFRKVPHRFQTGVKAPQPDWIEAGLNGDSAVWLNVGWYRYSHARKKFVRQGGHWVTLVGFGVDQNGNEDPSILIIHDPADNTCKLVGDYVRPMRINGGKILGGDGALIDAARYFRLTGIKVSRNIDTAILDGAIRLQMSGPNVMSAGNIESAPAKTTKQ